MASVERLKIQEGRLALAAGGVAIAASLLGVWSRTTPPRPLPLPPAAGRSAEDAARGPDARFAHIPSGAEAALRVFGDRVADLDARLPLDALPEGVERALVYPFSGPVPRTDLEDGPPWHLLLDEEGTVRIQERLRRRLAAVPPGMPRGARRALHVAVPNAGRMDAPRRRMLATLIACLARHFPTGKDAVRLADRLRGSTFRVPPDVRRTDFESGSRRR